MNERWREFFKKNTVLLLIAAIGLVIVLLPTGQKKSKATTATATDNEARLTALLQSTEGVGKTRMLLAESGERNGGYTGAAVICEGAGKAGVRLRVTDIVSAFTGLTSDKIVICKMTSQEG